MDMVELVEQQRHYFASGKTLSVSFRIKQLRRLKFVLTQHEQELLDALKADLNKSAGEAYMTELAMVHAELNDAIHHAKSWRHLPLSCCHPLSFPLSAKLFPILTVWH